MLNTRQEYKGFNTTKPVESLLPVEALALLNRWAKLRNYFYYDDIDLLYKIKEEKIAEWLKSKEVRPTFLIVRESPAITGMKVELANGGKNLEWLNFNSHSLYLSEAESKYFELLNELSGQWSESGLSVNYPQEIYDNWMLQIQPEIEAYEIAKREYDAEFQRRQPLLENYNKSLEEYQKQQAKTAKDWAKTNNIRIARSNSGKSLKKDWLKRLEKQGFSYKPKPSYPFPSQLKSPKPPEIPSKTYIVNFENYLPGSLLEVEEVLDWAKSIVELPENPCEIDEDFICFELDMALNEIVLNRVKKEVLKVFEKVVEGQLSNPQEIYARLTEFEIDYSEAIGMQSYTNFHYYQTSHRDFGKWHEINLSPTGHWLIEFQSTIEPSITFHVPYNRNLRSPIKINLDKLPKITTEQAKFGREITFEEKKQYPLQDLLKILGSSPEDFPFELQRYYREVNYQYENCDEDEDWFG